MPKKPEKLNHSHNDEAFELDDDEVASVASDDDVASEIDEDDEKPASDTATFSVKAMNGKDAGFSIGVRTEDAGFSIGLQKPAGSINLENLEDDDIKTALETAKEQALRLQKIAQKYEYMHMLETSTDVNLDQASFTKLMQSVEKEINKFNDDQPIKNQDERRHPRKYDDPQLIGFHESTINLYRGMSLNKQSDNHFQITQHHQDQDKTVDVFLDRSNKDSSELTNKILINGSKDTITTMLLAAMLAKKDFGADVKYSIYPSNNIEGMAELFARAKILGLNPELKCHPNDGKKTAEEYKQEFDTLTTGDKKSEFNSLVAKYTEIYKLNDNYKPQPGHERKKATNTTTREAPEPPSDEPSHPETGTHSGKRP